MVSVVIPAHNEEKSIKEVITRLIDAVTVDYEIVVVNDHSSDNTKAIVEELRKRYKNIILVDNTEPRGFANTLLTGFKAARGELIVSVMADLCDDPVLINKMYQKINQGYDIVCGSRYMRGGQKIGGPPVKTFLSSLAGRIIYILGVPTHDITNSFKMYKREIIEAIDLEAESFEISMEIPLKAYLKGFKIAEIPTVWNSRREGESSFKMLKLIPVYIKLYSWVVMKSFLNLFSFRGRRR